MQNDIRKCDVRVLFLNHVSDSLVGWEINFRYF